MNEQKLVIYVPSGITPVHGFDLWGTLVKQSALGPRVTEAYQTLMKQQHVSDEVAAQHVENYNALLRGEAWATGERKKSIVDAVEEPLWKAYAKGHAHVDFKGTFYDDAIKSVVDILSAGEGFCIITTGNSFWVTQALKDVEQSLGDASLQDRIGKVYFGSKATPKPFEDAANDIANKNGMLVSHTEDQLAGFKGLLESKLKGNVATIYVERAALATPETVKVAGVDRYVTDLGQIAYTSFVQK